MGLYGLFYLLYALTLMAAMDVKLRQESRLSQECLVFIIYQFYKPPSPGLFNLAVNGVSFQVSSALQNQMTFKTFRISFQAQVDSSMPANAFTAGLALYHQRELVIKRYQLIGIYIIICKNKKSKPKQQSHGFLLLQSQICCLIKFTSKQNFQIADHETTFQDIPFRLQGTNGSVCNIFQLSTYCIQYYMVACEFQDSLSFTFYQMAQEPMIVQAKRLYHQTVPSLFAPYNLGVDSTKKQRLIDLLYTTFSFLPGEILQLESFLPSRRMSYQQLVIIYYLMALYCCFSEEARHIIALNQRINIDWAFTIITLGNRFTNGVNSNVKVKSYDQFLSAASPYQEWNFQLSYKASVPTPSKAIHTEVQSQKLVRSRPYITPYLLNASQFFNNIYISSMRISAILLIISSVLLLTALASTQQCPKGHIKIKTGCVDCKTLTNTLTDDVESSIEGDGCPCKPGYAWSKVLLRCWAFSSPSRSILSDTDEKQMDSQQQGQVSRLLQTGCNIAQGFITSGSSCLNCRLFPNAVGVALSSSKCVCANNFYWSSNQCYCGYQKYIDSASNFCNPCSSAPAGQITACKNCAFPFVRGNTGCVLCLTLANNGGSDSCCATGYKFNSATGSCVCDLGSGYAVAANGVCTQCIGTDTNCINCVNTYFYNGAFCIFGALIPNLDPATGSCKPGYAVKTDVATGVKISCACATSQGFYQNGAQCNSCTTSPPATITTATCKTCPLASKFYPGSPECIYCPGVAFSTAAVPTANGCSCQPNYYWNSNTDQCECDFSVGLVGGAIANCIVCENIPNTAQTVSQNGCSCVPGYKWNPQSNTCDCDTLSPSVFQQGPTCIDCAIIPGSSGEVGGDGASCVCINSFIWNSGANTCQCDSDQNFAVFPNGFCTDCLLASGTIGLGYASGCVCQNGLVWNAATATCSCPSGYAVIGSTCTSCTRINTQFGKSISDCTDCVTGSGFASKNGVCALCSSQRGGTCGCSTGQVWNPQLGGCVCDWANGYVTYINPDGNTFACADCPYVWTSNNECACGFSFFFQSSTYTICSNCLSDPNAYTNSKGNCVCNTGYQWSEATYPFKCVPSSSNGYFMSLNGGSTTYPSCATLSSDLQSPCTTCDIHNGFLFISGINSCLYCPSVTGSTGNAYLGGCVCDIGYKWNPAGLSCDNVTCSQGYLYNLATLACDICDPVRSARDPVCIPCQDDPNSNGYADTPFSCACLPSFSWTNGACSTNASCDTTTSVWVGNNCYLCDTSENGGGLVSGNCTCLNGFTWKVNGLNASCICDPATSIFISGSCSSCSGIQNSTGVSDNRGGCQCANRYVWVNSSQSCICDSTVNAYVTPSGNCFSCQPSTDRNFDGTIANGTCNCLNGFVFYSTFNGGRCACNSPSVILPSGVCSICPANANSTGNFAYNGSCECLNKFFWSPQQFTCICDASVNATITSSGACFPCLPSSDPNFDGSITNGVCTCKFGWIFTPSPIGGRCTCDLNYYILGGNCTACPNNTYATGLGDDNGCACRLNYVWDPIRGDCFCDASVSAVIINGTCFQCSQAINPNFDGNIVNNTCNCINGFTPSFTNGLPSCLCTNLTSAAGTCFTCPIDANTPGTTNGSGCTCINGYLWDPVALACVCNQANSIVGTNGTCLLCGKPGTFTTTRRNRRSCNCAANTIWNSAYLMCDCGPKKAMIVTGNTFTCVTCNRLINAAGKDTPFKCLCNSNVVTWNPISKSCDCGGLVLYNSSCIRCDASKYSNGPIPSRPGTCNCSIPAMSWSNTYGYCTCTSTSTVMFNINNTLSCQSCGLPTKSVSGNRATPFACRCGPNSAWVANFGCVCTGQNTITITSGSNTICVTCGPGTYSSGPAANKAICICLGSLAWLGTTCGCAAGSAISISNGQYFCSPCNVANNAKIPVVNLTQCTCVSGNLTWWPQGYCGCPSPLTQVTVAAGASTRCVTCDTSINANGKTSPTSNTCTCISTVLSYNNGMCDCGLTSAFIVQGLSVYKCIACTNPATFLKNKYSATRCSCVSEYLTWDPSSGTCNCIDSDKVVVGTGVAARCSTCYGQYTVAPTSYTTCSCMGTGLIFSSTTTSMSCKCLANNIISMNFVCTACSVISPPTPYECKCPINQIWKINTQKCVACGLATNSKTTAPLNNYLVCNCNTGFVWDVMTQTCITPCNVTANGTACMNCNIPYAVINATAFDPALSNSTNNFTLSGSATILPLINVASTNYASIKNYMCSCTLGYKWDFIRLRCFNQYLI